MEQITLTDHQEAEVLKAFNWFNNDTEHQQLFRFGGYAGTGKTTSISDLVQRLGVEPLYAAFTGKAALVMSIKNDIKASTIHSLIYKLVPPNKQRCEELFQLINNPESELGEEEKKTAQKELDQLSEPRFEMNNESELFDAELLIIDECSMVSEEMLNDLLSFKVPILAIGDPGQLPPPKGAGAVFGPHGDKFDAKLTQIMRQADESPIIEMATRARMGIPWGQTAEGWDKTSAFYCRALDLVPSELRKEIVLTADQVICGMNKTRKSMNVEIRNWLNFDVTNPFPQVGEILICERNDKELGIFNGMQATVIEVGELYDNFIELFIRTEVQSEADKPIRVRAMRAPFEEYFDPDAMKAVKPWDYKNTHTFNFGYCITVHKAQGSQWDRVCFIDDGLFKGWKPVERKKFVYTAATRAAEYLNCLIK